MEASFIKRPASTKIHWGSLAAAVFFVPLKLFPKKAT
jgi:hypothetical protein